MRTRIKKMIIAVTVANLINKLFVILVKLFSYIEHICELKKIYNETALNFLQVSSFYNEQKI